MYCQICNAYNPDGTAYCSVCGSPLTSVQPPRTNKYCGRCGTENPALARFCYWCGLSFTGGPNADAYRTAAYHPETRTVYYRERVREPESERERRSVPLGHNTAALVLGIFGILLAIVGAFLSIFLSNLARDVSALGGAAPWKTKLYLGLFIALGIGGALFALIGSIQAYRYRGGRVAWSVLGFLMEVGCLVAQCVGIGGFSFLLSSCTVLGVLFLFIETCLSGREPAGYSD